MELKDSNPYAPPQASLNSTFGGGKLNPAPTMSKEKAEAIRRELLGTETNLRGFGSLYLLSAVGSVFVAISLPLLALVDGGDSAELSSLVFVLGTSAVIVLIGAIYGYVGLGLRRLDPGVKLGATILAGLSLVSIPIGTMLGGYLLFLLHGEKGQRVFAPDYAEVRELTPHIKYKTSIVVWAFLALIILVIFVGIGAALLAI